MVRPGDPVDPMSFTLNKETHTVLRVFLRIITRFLHSGSALWEDSDATVTSLWGSFDVLRFIHLIMRRFRRRLSESLPTSRMRDMYMHMHMYMYIHM